jgi:hypothetical protein
MQDDGILERVKISKYIKRVEETLQQFITGSLPKLGVKRLTEHTNA